MDTWHHCWFIEIPIPPPNPWTTWLAPLDLQSTRTTYTRQPDIEVGGILIVRAEREIAWLFDFPEINLSAIYALSIHLIGTGTLPDLRKHF